MKKLRNWVFEWLDTYKKIMIKPSTYDSYLQYATHVTCEKYLDELSSADVQCMINDMVLQGSKLSTIKHMLTIVRQSLYKARSLGMIYNLSMLENLELPKSRPKKIRALTPGQIQIIFDNAHRTYYGDFYKALIFTGCRVGELIALRWCDVDFFNKELHIRHTDYHGQLQEVKTAHGCRIIPLYGELLNIFQRLSKGRFGERVFTNTLDRPIIYRTLLDNWHWFCNSIGLYEPLGFHVLRHTFAHTALRTGIPVKVVSAWLGHADVRITLDIYDSVDNNDFLNAAELLKDRFSLKTKKAAYKLLL